VDIACPTNHLVGTAPSAFFQKTMNPMEQKRKTAMLKCDADFAKAVKIMAAEQDKTILELTAEESENFKKDRKFKILIWWNN